MIEYQIRDDENGHDEAGSCGFFMGVAITEDDDGAELGLRVMGGANLQGIADGLATLTIELAKATDPRAFLALYHDTLAKLFDGSGPEVVRREVEVESRTVEPKTRRRRGFTGRA